MLALATSRGTSAAGMQTAAFRTGAKVRDFFAESLGEIDLMILFLYKDLANLLRYRVLAKALTLPDAIAVITNGFVFVVEIVPEHFLRILRRAHGPWRDDRHLAEIVDLSRQGQRMIELLLGVDFELSSDVHILGASEHLGIDHVGDDGLIFASEVFVQQLRETVAGSFFLYDGRLGLGHYFLLKRRRRPDQIACCASCLCKKREHSQIANS